MAFSIGNGVLLKVRKENFILRLIRSNGIAEVTSRGLRANTHPPEFEHTCHTSDVAQLTESTRKFAGLPSLLQLTGTRHGGDRPRVRSPQSAGPLLLIKCREYQSLDCRGLNGPSLSSWFLPESTGKREKAFCRSRQRAVLRFIYCEPFSLKYPRYQYLSDLGSRHVGLKMVGQGVPE